MRAADRNRLQAAHFDSPSFIPVEVEITPPCWSAYPHDFLKELVGKHPLLFPAYEENCAPPTTLPPWTRAGAPYRDSWGSLWESRTDGLTGYVIDHPLKDWDGLHTFAPPDPESQNGWGPISWDAERTRIERQQAGGHLGTGSLRRGHTFMTYSFLRGYLNLVFDLMDEEPRSRQLLDQITEFNAELVERFVDLGIQWLDAPEDLGMETGPMLTPAQFNRYLRPCYERIFSPVPRGHCVIRVRNYGNIQPLIPELVEVGIDVLGIQDTAMELDWLTANLKGKICIDATIDRRALCFGQPDDVNRRVYRVISTLGSKQGGLMLHHELLPGCPPENIRALLNAMENYADCFS